MLLTRKFAIHPTKEQEIVLWDLSDLCRQIYNLALFERKFLYDKYGSMPSYIDQQNALPQLKTVFPRFKQVNAKALRGALRKLDAAYKSFFGLRKKGETSTRPPRFRSRHYFFTLCYNQHGFKFTSNTVKLSHKHVTNVPLLFDAPFDLTTYKVKQVECFQDRVDKKYYIVVIYETQEPTYQDNEFYQAFDLGVMKHVAVNTAGKFLESKVRRPDKYWHSKVQSLQQRRDHCKKGSRRWRKFHQRLLTIQRRSANQTKDWQHKQTLHLLKNTRANTLIVGDLSVKQMTQSTNKPKQARKGINRAVQNTGHLTRFIELLTYKAQKLGKKIIVIDERDTSKTCCLCGKTQEMPLYKRIYECECGNCIDRDHNSAVNIMLRFLSRHAPRVGYQLFVDKLRYTANHKTKIPSR
ncbi:MAG: RNA-guided endonuclease InsQ/TnpB family protein [Candidatus Hermodarchaeota archaeon]